MCLLGLELVTLRAARALRHMNADDEHVFALEHLVSRLSEREDHLSNQEQLAKKHASDVDLPPKP